jgi:hypothetical protein
MHRIKPSYLYRVTVYVVTLDKNGKKRESVHRSKDFYGNDILVYRENAFKYFSDMVRAYIYTLAKCQDCECEVIFPYYVLLSFVHRLSDHQEEVYTLLGGSDEESGEAREFERNVLAQEWGILSVDQ